MLAWKTDPARAPAQPCARTRLGAEQRGARSRVHGGGPIAGALSAPTTHASRAALPLPPAAAGCARTLTAARDRRGRSRSSSASLQVAPTLAGAASAARSQGRGS